MHTTITLTVALLTALGVLLRPFRLPEYAFAALGAAVLVVSGLFDWRAALSAVNDGQDVYAFLIGMMLLAEVARREGLFTTLAAWAARAARGSAQRLFLIIYGIGVLVTVFLSNDATAVVLTPAVYATARAAKVEPLPYLFACAMIANAASFVLPISNPANLVIYARAMPPLAAWLAMFLLPSTAAILATYAMLRLVLRRDLAAQPQIVEIPALEPAARAAAIGLVITALVLMSASALGAPLGFPTLGAGVAVVALVTALTRRSPVPLLHQISWGVLPLVGDLFVVVRAVFATGLPDHAVAVLHLCAQTAPNLAASGTGTLFALASNLINNLPVGLVAATASHTGNLPPHIVGAMLIGVDLGPNLSATGSLATILWLVSLRKEGLHVSAAEFLRVGLCVMPPALALTLAAYALQSGFAGVFAP
jgi:arsenical pump membrane protein